MKNKGFTMVEIIVVIALLAVLAVIIGTNVVGLQGKQKDKTYNAFKEKLESAACLYMEKNENSSKKKECRQNNSSASCNVTVDTLIKASLIDEDLKDPSTNEIVNKSKIVKVKWVNNEQVCEYQE